MLDLLLKFAQALTNSLPKLFKFYKKNRHEGKIIELLESYYILGDLIEMAEELLSIVRNKDTIDFSHLSKKDLEDKLNRIESRISLQKLRLKRLGEIYLSNPTIELLDSNIKLDLKKALGSKSEGGLYGLASSLLFHQIFDFSGFEDETDREWLVRVTDESHKFILEITEYDKQSIEEQDRVLNELKELKKLYLEKLNDILTDEDKTILASKAKELANKYVNERNELII